MAPLNLLFVCVGNSCRSIMAEAIARRKGGEKVIARSVGLAPAGFVAAPTFATLEALGYPTAGLRSEGLEAVSGETFDVVVSLIGERGLELLPSRIGHRLVVWDLPDPFGEDDTLYLHVARRLEELVSVLVAEELREELRLD
jgi:protein-tyrosine-phosphatase